MTGLGLLASPTQAPFNLTGRVSGVRVVILGAGVAGMTAAYELGKVGYDCRVLEARGRPGGRVFTVRRGTVSEEDGPSQTAAFDDGLYFNAGPMRISHHHELTLAYCRELQVPVEVFVPDCESAYLCRTTGYEGPPSAPLALNELLGGIPSFYVQTDWFSQPTMMQVVGGMDRLPAALAARLGKPCCIPHGRSRDSAERARSLDRLCRFRWAAATSRRRLLYLHDPITGAERSPEGPLTTGAVGHCRGQLRRRM